MLVDPVPDGGPQAGFAGTTVARQGLSLSPDSENRDSSRPGMSVHIVNCYGSYNKNLLKVIKHSYLYVYYVSLLFVGRHGSFDVNYHHTWHFMQ